MAGALVGGALLSSCLNVLFDRMASRPFIDLVAGQKNTSQVLDKLKMKILAANKLLDDAEEKQITSLTVRKWLDELKHVAYIAGDLLDEINTEALRRRLERDSAGEGTSNQVKSYFTTAYSTWFNKFDKTMECKIGDILDRLQLILDEKDVLGLKEGVEVRQEATTTRETTSLVDETGVYGRDNEKEDILKLLFSNDDKISVISIVGMGGIGKTTLAQLVYNDDGVREHFDVRAWVCVSEESHVLTITQKIYGSVTCQACGITELDPLQVKLKEDLMNKKFLIVLDDVWKVTYIDWDVLGLPFQYGAHDSKIIVTTRNKDIAVMTGTLPPYLLSKISEQDCWLLFAKHAFQNAQPQPQLEAIGRQIVRKCDGLPLAAKSLGGLLRYESHTKEWENVLDSTIWELSDKDQSKILPALWLSYRYLPSHLKRCFAYCSIFPKDYEFQKSELILLWMAEDLLKPERNKTMEEVGDNYFDDLISRSFFQQQNTETEHSSHVTMHNLINGLAKFIAGDFCLRLEDDKDIFGSKTRQFSYMESSSFNKFGSLHEAKYLHTFLQLGQRLSKQSVEKQVLHNLFETLQYLRVLNLAEYDISELPSSIGNLKHLRYLDLSYSQINKLPDAICSLYNLQTLLLSGCQFLMELPTNLRRLINLRHLDISSIRLKRMPPDMGKLRHLQTLSDFVVGKDAGHSILELKELPNLRKALTISRLDCIASRNVVDCLDGNVLGNKKYLDKLVLTWGGGGSDQEDPEKDRKVLDKLQPHANLKQVMIEGYWGITFPSWLGDPSFCNISSIQLRNCKHCCLLPALGQLPSLTSLEIVGFKNVVEIGEEFYGNYGTFGHELPFRSLKELTFRDMLEWRKWSYFGFGFGLGGNHECGIFPNLQVLRLVMCPKLSEMLPLDMLLKLERLELKSFGGSLAHHESESPKFLSLNHLEMWGCPNFVCFPEGGMDAPKLKEIHLCECEKLRSLPQQMHTLLPSLESLQIRDCPQLESFPPQEEGGFPTNLESLEFDCSRKLFANQKQWGLGRLECLRDLRIDFKKCDYGQQLEFGLDSPFLELEEDLLPNTLTCLYISNHPNLTTIQAKELNQLESFKVMNCRELHSFTEEAPNSLKWLQVGWCPKLQCLPREWLPTSLSRLEIWECPMVEQRLQRESGEDWPNVARIPHIKVGWKTL